MEKLMLRPREAAESIAVGRTLFYQLVKAKVIPSCRVGKAIRIPAAEFRAWAEGQTKRESRDAVPKK